MKLKNILIIAMAIVTLGLVVACSDDVVVASKDNNTNYTQVLESNGAFEYNGTKYETLQDAIEAIDKAKGYALKTIKVLKDVNSDGATVPATSGITLNLNGKTLSFLTSTGVTTNGVFYVEGEGEVTFAEGVTNGTAFVVNEGGNLAIIDTTINVADQYAVKASGAGATVTFGSDAAVAGNIAASDSAAVTLANGSDVSGAKTVSSSATLNINSESVGDVTGPITLSGGNAAIRAGLALTDAAPIAMQGSSQLSVNTGAAAYISEFDSTCTTCTIYCSVSDAASITAAEGVEIPTSSFVFGFCYVASGNEKVYFTSLEEAVTFAKDGGTVTYVRDHSETGASTLTYTIAETVTVNMGSFKENSNLIIASGETLTLQGGTLNGTVNGSGALESTNATFNAALGGTTALAALTDGTNGGTDPVYAEGSIFKGAIKATGDIELFDSTIQPSLTEVDYDFVRSEGSITMGGVKFKNQYVGVCAAKGESVNMTNSTGEVYKIVATSDGSTTPGKITIDNSMTSSTFTIINEVAARVGEYSSVQYNDVTIIGHAAESVLVDVIDAAGITISYARVTNNAGQAGARANTGDFKSDNSVFDSIVEVHGYLLDGTGEDTANGSEFKSNISANDALTFYGSKFTGSPTITSTNGGNITIMKSTGSAGAISAIKTTNKDSSDSYDAAIPGTITINNSALTATNADLTTGALTSRGTANNNTSTPEYYYKDVTLTGSSTSGVDLSVGAIIGNEVESKNATVGGSVTANASVQSMNSVFNNTVHAETTVTDGVIDITVSPNTYSNGSTFNGAITASGNIELRNSTTKANVTSNTSVTAYNATLGDSATDDNIYAPVIVVDDSQIKANKVMKSYTGTSPVETAADVISLTNLKGASSITRVLGAYLNTATYSNDYVVYITKASGTLTLGSTDNVAVEAQGNSAKAAIYIADVETDGETPVTDNIITINGAVTGNTAGEVKIVGAANHVVAANKKITSAGSVYVDYATNGTASLTESIAAGTSVTTKNSTFNGTVVAGTTVTDGTKAGTADPYTYSNGSTFKSNVTARGNMYFYSSVFDSSSVNIETDGAGSIDMYNCSGTTGAIKSHKDVNSGTGYGAGAITIDNSTVATGKALNATGGVYSYGKLDSTEMTWNTVTLRGPNSVAYSSSATTNVVISGGITSNNLTAQNIGVNNYSVIVHGQATIYGGVIDGRVTLGDGTSGSTKSSNVSVYTIASGTDAGSHKSIMKGGFFVGDYHTLTINDGEFGDSNSSTSAPIMFDTAYSSAKIINGTFYVGTPSGNGNASYLENVIESFYYDGSMSNEVNIYLTDDIVMDRQINTPAYKNVEFYGYGNGKSILNSSTSGNYIRVDTGKFNLYNMTLTNNGTSNYNPIFAIYGGAYVYNITCTLDYDNAIKTMN